MNEILGEVEFAIRAYITSTEHLVEVLARYDKDIPPAVTAALLLLSNAIKETWDA